MKVSKGQFVFIKDSFLDKYFPPIISKDGKINSINHGKGRPFFYVFDESDDIAWVVPISSDKTGKKHAIYEQYKKKETKNRPNSIAVGNVDDIDSAFDFSMMFPVPKTEIERIYYSKKYKYFPIKRKESEKIIKLAKEYKRVNDNNVKLGLKNIIKSPYEQILKDIKKYMKQIE